MPPARMSDALLLLMLCKTGLRRRGTPSGTMIATIFRDEERAVQDKESAEENVLAMLGIIGTILNLLVIIFVYIYTTL